MRMDLRPRAARIAPVLELRRPSSLIRWMVLVAVWLGVCAPAMSMALATLRGDVMPWTQICRASVVSPRALGGSWQQPREDGSAQDHGLFKHCAGCVQQHAQDLAPPPVPMLPVLNTGLHHAMPERFYSAPQTAHAWRPALARAPPLSL